LKKGAERISASWNSPIKRKTGGEKMKNPKMKSKHSFIIDPIANEYNTKKSLYERVVNFVMSEFENYFEDVHTDSIYYVKGRVKNLWSIYEKMVRKKTRSLMNIKDICGIRVVCLNEFDKEFVYKFIENNPNFGSVDREIISRREDGYSGWHIKMQARVTYKGITKWHPVEIQLRTLAEDYFNTKSHREIYKKLINLPFDWKKMMKELREKVDEIEKLSGTLREEWEKINASMEFPQQNYLNIKSIQAIIKSELGEELSTEEAHQIFKYFLIFGINQIHILRKIIKDSSLEDRFNSIKENIHIRQYRPLDIILIKMTLYLTTDDIAISMVHQFIRNMKKIEPSGSHRP